MLTHALLPRKCALIHVNNNKYYIILCVLARFELCTGYAYDMIFTVKVAMQWKNRNLTRGCGPIDIIIVKYHRFISQN